MILMERLAAIGKSHPRLVDHYSLLTLRGTDATTLVSSHLSTTPVLTPRRCFFHSLNNILIGGNNHG
jgi:hypothetical protein